MNDLIIQIVSGLVVLVIGVLFGIGSTRQIIIRGAKTRKTGKWIILISFVMIFGGLAWMGSNDLSGFGDWLKPPTIYGFTLTCYGFIFLVIGKIVAWFQK